MNSFLSQNIDTYELDLALSLDAPISTDHIFKSPRENPLAVKDFSFSYSHNDVPGPSSHSLSHRTETNNQIPSIFTQFPNSPPLHQATNISQNFFSLRSVTDRENENIFASGQCSPENTLRSTLPADNNVQVDWSCIPLSVQKLHQEITKSLSDWSFVYAIAAQLCQDILPMDCYVNLKMGLLLSIASTQVRNVF